jgi:hypothetical protein
VRVNEFAGKQVDTHRFPATWTRSSKEHFPDLHVNKDLQQSVVHGKIRAPLCKIRLFLLQRGSIRQAARVLFCILGRVLPLSL